MAQPAHDLPPAARSLSARLLLFTIAFVMLSEVLIYVPSIARYRLVYLQERATEAHLATLALDAAPERRLPAGLEQRLLDHAAVLAVELWRPDAELMLGRMPAVDAHFDLARAGPLQLILDAFDTLRHQGERVISVVTPARGSPGVRVEVYLDEGPLFQEMADYSWRILQLSIVISLITAGLVYLALQWLLVRPLRRLTVNLMAFREAPEDPGRVLEPCAREDEMGVLEREVARMQTEVRTSLAQKTRLAALGTAMSKISHDLRGLLNTADLFAERLQRVDDPAARQVTPLLVNSLGRAVGLCTQTLDLARGEQAVPRRTRFPLRDLLTEVGDALDPGAQDTAWELQVAPGLEVSADHERLYRVFLNLGRNALAALGEGGTIRIVAGNHDGVVRVDVCDSGPGIPEAVRRHLFTPFAGSGSAGGTGLGLATARDLVRAHGGDLWLLETGSAGTTFRMEFPLTEDGK